MIIISPTKLSYTFENENCYELTKDRFICGEIWGYHNPFSGITLHKKAILEKLKTTSSKEIEDILLHSVGNFYFLEKKEESITIKTCPSFLDGLFYIKKNSLFLFSTCEKDLHLELSTMTLEEDLIFNEFYGESISILSNKTFCKEVKKVPAGSICQARANGDITQQFYVFEKFKQFEEMSLNNATYRKKVHAAIEKTVEIIADANKHKPIFLLLSDGIDSVSIFFTLLKLNVKFTAINITDFTPLIGMIDKLKEIIKNNQNVSILDLHLSKLKATISHQEITRSAQSYFRLRGVASPLYAVINYFEKNKIKSPILLTGGGFDIIYHGRKTGSSIEVGTSFYYAHVKYFFKRFYRHYTYLKLLASNRFSWLFRRVRNKAIPYDPINYVASFVAGPDALDDGFYPFTMPNKGPEFSNQKFKNIFYDIRKRETVDAILHNMYKSKKTWSPKEINLLHRSAMTYSHFGLPNIFHDPANQYACDVIEVGYQPSIFNLFIKAKVDSYKDLFKIKRAIFEYLNLYLKQYNLTYEKLAKTCRKSAYGLEYNFFKIITRPIISLKNRADIRLRSFLKRVLPKKIVARLKKQNLDTTPQAPHRIIPLSQEFLGPILRFHSIVKLPHLRKFFPKQLDSFLQKNPHFVGTNLEPAIYFSYYLAKNKLFSKITKDRP